MSTTEWLDIEPIWVWVERSNEVFEKNVNEYFIQANTLTTKSNLCLMCSANIPDGINTQSLIIRLNNLRVTADLRCMCGI